MFFMITNMAGGMKQLRVLKSPDGKQFDIFLISKKTQERIPVVLADDFMDRWWETDAEERIIDIFMKLRKEH